MLIQGDESKLRLYSIKLEQLNKINHSLNNTSNMYLTLNPLKISLAKFCTLTLPCEDRPLRIDAVCGYFGSIEKHIPKESKICKCTYLSLLKSSTIQ